MSLRALLPPPPGPPPPLLLFPPLASPPPPHTVLVLSVGLFISLEYVSPSWSVYVYSLICLLYAFSCVHMCVYVSVSCYLYDCLCARVSRSVSVSVCLSFCIRWVGVKITQTVEILLLGFDCQLHGRS